MCPAGDNTVSENPEWSTLLCLLFITGRHLNCFQSVKRNICKHLYSHWHSVTRTERAGRRYYNINVTKLPEIKPREKETPATETRCCWWARSASRWHHIRVRGAEPWHTDELSVTPINRPALNQNWDQNISHVRWKISLLSPKNNEKQKISTKTLN